MDIKYRKKYVSILTVFSLISILILTASTVSACHYNLGTFESDYETSKDSFFKGEIVYGMGEACGYDYPLKLRIRDPDGNVVYYSNESKYVVYGSFYLDDSAKVGTWNIQLGFFMKCCWEWSNDSGSIAYFTVSDANFTLTVNVNGNGSVTKDPDNIYYSYGSIVDVSAEADLGSSFSNWTGDINSCINPESILMDSDKTVTANFIENKYVLNLEIIGDGSVEVDPDLSKYTYGTLVNLTATPCEGCAFDYWSEDLCGYCNPETIVMTENKNVTAHFVTIEEEEENGGGGEVKGSSEKPNKPPVADLSAGESYIGFLNEEIDFDGSLSYDNDGHIIEWFWNFGDGTTGLGEITSHNYSSTGTYNVILIVTDNEGKSDTDLTTAVVALPNNPPSVPIVSGPSEGFIDIEYLFSVVSTDEDNDEIKYTVEWGDGNIDESKFLKSGDFFNISHKWFEPGDYIINVSAYDSYTIAKIDITITLDEEDIPEESNIIVIIILIIALLLLLIFLILSKPKKDKK